MSWVVFEKVSKKLGAKWIISELDLAIEQGEFFTLLGPSGCGKTTTLRLVAGLEVPEQGKIYLAGKEVTRVRPQERRVAMVFQNYALYPHLRVSENIAYPLRVRGVPKAEQIRRVKETSERLRISHLLDRMPSQISGGEQQRVALARAMVQEPKVFLFDEPLSNLDARLRLEARRFLRRIQKELAITAIYVTHDQAEAMALSDRIAVMKQGRVIQIGTPEEIYLKPAEIFVAGFVGNFPMNFLDGTAELANGKIYFRSEEFRLLLPVSQKIKPGEKITLGIRPEHIEGMVGESLGPSPSEEELTGIIEDLEQLGSELILSVLVSSKTLLVRHPGKMDLKPGTKIRIKIPQIHLHLFDQQGKRIT